MKHSKLLLVLIIFVYAILCISCTTKVKYVETETRVNLSDYISPVFDTRPGEPRIIDVQSLNDVMENSVSWQIAFYQMSDYATSLENLIQNVIVRHN